jgi:hypothetical protein
MRVSQLKNKVSFVFHGPMVLDLLFLFPERSIQNLIKLFKIASIIIAESPIHAAQISNIRFVKALWSVRMLFMMAEDLLKSCCSFGRVWAARVDISLPFGHLISLKALEAMLWASGDHCFCSTGSWVGAMKVPVV